MSSTTITSAVRSVLHRLRGAVHPWQILEEKREAVGRRSGIGDDHLDAQPAQQMGQPDLAAEAVAIRIDVGGQADPLPRQEHGGQGPRRGGPIGGEGEGHGENLTGGGVGGRSDGRTVGRSDGRTVGRSDGRVDVRLCAMRRHPERSEGDMR